MQKRKSAGIPGTRRACQRALVAPPAWAPLIGVLLLCAGSGISQAVVIAKGDGSGNTQAPEDDPGFAHVGILNGGSAVYLGNRWVLTASHVGAGEVDFGPDIGVFTHRVDETYRLDNPAELGLDTPKTDMLLVRLDEEPPLPALHLPCRSPRITSEVLLVGAGRRRAEEETFWKVTFGPNNNDDVWVEQDSSVGANKTGYKTTGEREVRWGKNLVGVSRTADSNFGEVASFETSFALSLPVTDVAQGVRGDSGGAVFQKNDGIWELVGMMHAVSQFDNQPGATTSAILGQVTFVADLFSYLEELREHADFEPQVGDIDGDGLFTAYDIDRLFEAIREDYDSCHYDLTGDGVVDLDDQAALLAEAGGLSGDANLDGSVEFGDFLALSNAFAQPGGWANGDFDGNGQVEFDDFLVLSRHFGETFVPAAPSSDSSLPGNVAELASQGTPSSVRSVPEPGGIWLLSLGLPLLLRRLRPLRRA